MSRKASDGVPRDSHPDEAYLRVAQENDARLQPDPELALGTGTAASRTQIWLTAMSAAVIAGLVLYAITQTSRETETAAAPPTQTTGAAPASEQGGTSPQENAAPVQSEQMPGKQGPSDSAR